MSQHTKKGFLLGILVMALLLQPHLPAAAALDPAAAKTNATFWTDTSLSGGITSTQHFFRIENYWTVESVEVRLEYKASPLTQSERSGVTLLLNGTPFHSFRPVISPAEREQITVSVPVSLLVPGSNVLTVQGRLETTVPDTNVNQACVPADRNNWLQIFKTSRVSVKYAVQSMKGSIREFNEQFKGLDTFDEEMHAIVVPANSAASELEAATYVLSGYAQASQVKDKTIPLLEEGMDDARAKRAVILVALYERLPADIRALVDPTELKDKALIQLVQTNGRAILVLTSSDPGLLTRAGRFAANQSLLGQLDADRKFIEAGTEVETPPFSLSRTITLTETGDRLTGIHHREQPYFVALPGNRSLSDASKVSFEYRYSRNVDFDRSLVTVLINDSPIGSKRLSSELADGDRLEMLIPKTLNVSGSFTVKLAFDLELKEQSCAANQDQMPWAFIDPHSKLQLNMTERAELLLSSYPYPFLRDGSYNQVAVVLPKERDPYTIQSLANVFHLLGQYAQTNTGTVRFYDDTVSAGELEGKEIIAIGTYRNNRIIRENNEKLYFRYDPSGSGFVSNEKISLESEYGKRIGTLQLIDSPYEGGHGLLAVTGSGSDYAYMASKLIATDAMLWRLVGDAALTDRDGQIRAFRFKKEAAAEPSGLWRDVAARKDVVGFMTIAMMIVLLVLVSLLLLIRKYRKRRGGER
ncbi:cellulose biosynthesis cyclic di-GMP-binding regulatory protein BcsB [Paenibacillus sp. HJGM_3]|uniref:cellulose biosynthesis cyclic di-GMP-binding regulatory protein BcsB n=1 Tax=Paenibacillus sp. HJGM_3 TaxID=3379816 RepID=UPI00385B7CB8